MTKPRKDLRSLAILLAGLLVVVVTLASALGLGSLGPFSGSAPSAGPEAEGAEPLTAIAFDLGIGESTLVIAPGGYAMLVDAGDGPSDCEETILPYLKEAGVERLDYLVLSHPHQDHVGGMPAVLGAIEVDTVVLSGQVHTNQAYEATLRELKERGVEVVRARSGRSFRLGPEVQVEIIWPPEPLLAGEDEVNENSVVLRVSHGEINLLLTGDIGEEAQAALLLMTDDLRSQVLKVAHHGARSPRQAEWLAAVAPEVAIISVGADNPYGHPDEETLAALEERGASVYRTDLRGAVTVTSDGHGYKVSSQR